MITYEDTKKSSFVENFLKCVISNSVSIHIFHHRKTEKFLIKTIFVVTKDHALIDITKYYCRQFKTMRNMQYRMMVKKDNKNYIKDIVENLKQYNFTGYIQEVES